jgi:hypothetical protein
MTANPAISSRAMNAQVLDMLDKQASSPEMVKQAADTISEYTRVRMREDGFWRKILPPLTITNDDLDRSVSTDKPVRIVDKEVNSPAAISIPYGTLPINEYIIGERYQVTFDRIVTPRFTKDVDELRTYDMDLRQVLSDNAIKDMLAEEDGKAILAVNAALGGSVGSTVGVTGVIQWKAITSSSTTNPITRDAWADAMKILPSTPMHLTATTILINNVSIYDVCKWGRDEVGGDLAEEILQNGFAERQLMGCRVLVTIKRDLVPDSSIYMFARPETLGKFFLLEDTTMYIDRKAYMLEFYAYESIGSAIGNVAAIGRADFAVTT